MASLCSRIVNLLFRPSRNDKRELTEEINSLLVSIGASGKSCTLQWIPAHVDIEENTMVDSLANEARTLDPLTSSTTVFDANAVPKQKTYSNPRKKNYRC
ncbi:RNase H domain-containing protein [Trichonephila clavipes]|nr:RNase H domain-containing protein [Trichonephila clavipes]